MLKVMEGLQEGVLGIEGSGRISKNDYLKTLIPELEKRHEKSESVSLLFYLNETYEGYTPGAIFEDTQVGLKYSKILNKVAVVTDSSLISGAVNLFSPILSVEIKTFPIENLEEAKKFLITSPISDLDFHYDTSDNILTLTPKARLIKSDFNGVQNILNSVYHEVNTVSGVIINTKEFPGWEDLSTFKRHLEFIRHNRKRLDKVGICTDSKFISNIIPVVSKNISSIDIKVFKYGEIGEARDWILNIDSSARYRAV